MGPIGCSETSVRIYHYSLRNNPEERSSQGPVIRDVLAFSDEVIVKSGFAKCVEEGGRVVI